MAARYVWNVWANLQVKGDCKVLFGSVGDFVDTDFVRDIGHFIFCIYSCPLHFRCARFARVWRFVDRLRQRPFQDLCKVSVEMPSSSINQACLHNTVSICMIVDRAASARTPNQDKLWNLSESFPVRSLFVPTKLLFPFPSSTKLRV